jgi:hypothetical protein
MTLKNTDGTFTPNGWQSTHKSSQLFITLPDGLPFEGTFTVNIKNFDPYNQNISLKQPIIDLYSHPCGNKDIYQTDGAWFHLISGTGYETGVPGEAGFKLWAASRGVGSKHENRVMNNARWDPSHTYVFKFVWSGSHLYFYVDGLQRLRLPFSGQVEPFRYIFLGKDNLTYGYPAQPGPIFSDMRIYGPGDPVPDTTPPALTSVQCLSRDRIIVRFDEFVTHESATNIENYAISPSIKVLSAELQSDGKSVMLFTANHQEDGNYTLTVRAIKDTATTANVLEEASLTYKFVDQPITAISRPGYRLVKRAVGDSVYSDRPYVFTHIPSNFSDWFWILTANDHKSLKNPDFLSFYAAYPLTIVLAFDARIKTLPNWINEWQLTGQIIKTTDNEFITFQKKVETGQVILGGNEQSSHESMYLILFDPEIETTVDTAPAAPTGVRVFMTRE